MAPSSRFSRRADGIGAIVAAVGAVGAVADEHLEDRLVYLKRAR